MLSFSARSDIHHPEYTAPEIQHLTVTCTLLSGDGAADSPFLHQVTIRNDGDGPWSGVVKMDLSFDAVSPRFFMPGYLYGTNRGDAPLQGDSKVPRMRKGAVEFPASSWWMTRSDRMSHPAVFAFTGEKIVGLTASPYYLKVNGQIAPWTPGVSGDWLQYAGFGCDIDHTQISYTLGYENAPWFFLDAHHYSPRTPLSGNRFCLAQGEEVSFTETEFSYSASSETGLNAAMRKVYSMYHEPPRRCLSRGLLSGQLRKLSLTLPGCPGARAMPVSCLTNPTTRK